MKIKLTTSIAGREFAYAAGEEIDIAENEAQDLIARGRALPVRQKKVERATPKPKAERAVEN